MALLRTNHRALISFHTWPENGFGGGRRFGVFGSRLFKVMGFDTQKSFGDPAGSFSIQLKPQPGSDVRSLMDLWKEPEGVWAYMWLQINGQVFDVMLGNIDTVHEETVRSEDGSRSVLLTISGRDFGKIFAETELFINIHERSGLVPAIPLYRALADEIQFTPAQIVTALVREWVGNNELADTQWQLPPSLYGGQSFYSALNRSTIDESTRGNAQELTILQPDQQGQKLWDALIQYCNPVLNELWVDLAHSPENDDQLIQNLRGQRPRDPVTNRNINLRSVTNLQPALFLRERPFISSEFGHLKWDRLPTHDLAPEQYMTTSLAKGNSQERFNFWELTGASAQTQSINFIARVREQQDATVSAGGRIGNPGTVPIFNLTSIRRYGLRRFQQASRYFPVNDATLSELATGMIPRWLRLLHDWYSVAPREITGTIRTTYAMPWIRIGHRIRLRSSNGERTVFYVEGVQHSFSYPNNGSTSITVTRGEKEGEELLHDVYEELRDAPRSLNEVETAVPGMELTADQERILRENDEFIDSLLSGELGSSSLNDPASALDETGSPPGGARLLEATAASRSQGNSQIADPSMSFGDTAPIEDPTALAQGVEGIDSQENAPPDPIDSADPLETIQLEEVTINLDDEFNVNSAGASIPEPEEEP